MFNFRPIDGKLYAYAEPHGSISIGRIQPSFADKDKVSNVLVIFVARRPTGGQVIVGWYRNATVLSDCVRWDRRARGFPEMGLGSAGRHYNIATSAKHGLLLPLHKRTFDGVPAGAGGIGQSNICYVLNSDLSRKKEKWIDRALEYVRGYQGSNLLRDPGADEQLLVTERLDDVYAAAEGQGYAQTPAQRRAVEALAMRRAMQHFRKQYQNVEDVSAKASYDIHCSGGGPELHVEVKGTTGSGHNVFLTRNEVALAKKGKSALFVLHSITVKGKQAKGGETVILCPWNLNRGRLQPMAFTYTLP